MIPHTRASLYEDALDALAAKSRRRTLAPRAGLDFTSNDYLALASCERLRRAVAQAALAGTPVGAGGSRLLRGNAPEHERLETAAAHFFSVEHALYFASGYIANHAVLATLPQKEDFVLLDELIHASAHEGARAGRAQFLKARHNDPNAFDEAIRTWRARGGTGRPWLVIESIYSMDGDRAPLADFAALAERHDAMLIIDEAHATGIYGPDGRGLAAEAGTAGALEGRPHVLVIHTLSKALGSAGALLTAPRIVCEFLINRCRPFIYATAPSPLMAVAALEALNILRDEPTRREALARLVAHARRTAHALALESPSTSQIYPIIIGDDERTMALATQLQARGFDVRGIRPPTVPEGTARLRISLTLNVDELAVTRLFETLAELRA